MKTYSRYETQMTGATQFEVSAGNYTLSCELTWPQPIQDCYNQLITNITNSAKADPIIGDGNINRSYDWIEYYSSIPAFGAGMEEWYEEQTALPSSMRSLTGTSIYSVLTERRTLALGLKEYKQDLLDMLHWQMQVTDTAGNIMVCPVVPGAWYNNQADDYALRFVAEMDTIGHDDLIRTVIQVETYEYN